MHFQCLALLGITLSWLAPHLTAQERVVCRLFWQDTATQSLRYGDLKSGPTWSLKAEAVAGFPTLDVEQQSQVQLQTADGIVLTGIHDMQEGQLQSGWLAIESGVTQEAHGDHFHWRYTAAPFVIASRLDQQQGNPAHVYVVNGIFYVANDAKDGFTEVQPGLLRSGGRPADQFISAGGGHITLAVVPGQVAYATWIDRQGDNVGRVDVVGLGSRAGNRYQVRLPSGGIHGATTNSGKVFFAPSDGLCWTTADVQLQQRPEQVQVQHLSLGTDAQGNPKRTGAFENSGRHVLFTVGRGADPELCLVDAASPKPTVHKLPLTVAPGNTLTTPKSLQTRSGEPMAVLFEESASGEQAEKLHVIALDPNRDGSYTDAMLRTSLTVGRSQIEGHSGHHEATAIGKRWLAISNPGDGTIAVYSTSDWQLQATVQVGGSPTRIVAIGG